MKSLPHTQRQQVSDKMEFDTFPAREYSTHAINRTATYAQ